MASTMSEQDDPNPALWLATRAGLPAVSRKKNLANIQPSWQTKLGQ